MKYVGKSEHSFHIQLILSENLAVYDILQKNVVEPGRPRTTIRRMRF